MKRTRSDVGQHGLTLIELMLAVMLSLVVVLGAGAVYRGVDGSFRQGAHNMVGHQEATLLSTVISRRVRVASSFMVYTVPNRVDETATGNGLALLDEDGNVTYRLEWDATHEALTDSTGTRLCAATLQAIRFSQDATSPRTLRYTFRTVDEIGHFVDMESAVMVRN